MLKRDRLELERACNRLVNHLEDVIDDGAERPLMSIVYVCGRVVTISAEVGAMGLARAARPPEPVEPEPVEG